MNVRESPDVYFLQIARQVATRATCDRKHVGAVLVRDGVILSTGYNGSIRKLSHCDEVGHLMQGAPAGLDRIGECLNREITDDPSQAEPGTEVHAMSLALQSVKAELLHCVRTVHAEANAIAQAAREGIRTLGATLYTTASPCWDCFKLAVNAGVVRIVYSKFYRDERVFMAARELSHMIDFVSVPEATP